MTTLRHTTPGAQAEGDTRSAPITAVPEMARAILRQCAETLDRFSDEQYAAPAPDGSGGSVGKHVRHALDHFRALLEHPEDAIDYDRRDRGVPVETDRSVARDEIERLGEAAGGLSEVDLYRDVSVRVMLDGAGTTTSLPSTLGRELFFAVHHAIHHHAMIRSLACGMGVELCCAFGKAPSTLDHERRCGG